MVKFKELFSVFDTQALSKKNVNGAQSIVLLSKMFVEVFYRVVKFYLYACEAANTPAGRHLKCPLFLTIFNENWRFGNFIETSQYTITSKVFKHFSICYMQTDLRTEKIKKIIEFLYLFAENVSKFSVKMNTQNFLTLFGNYQQVFRLRMLRITIIVY